MQEQCGSILVITVESSYFRSVNPSVVSTPRKDTPKNASAANDQARKRVLDLLVILCLVGNEGMIHWLTMNKNPIPPFPSIPY